MAAITYTAKRAIVPLSPPWLITATDISAATADDSFNSSATVLTGLVSGNFIDVSGFSNAANNGWHQLAANSATNKITVLENLVAEAAGSTIVMTGYEHGSEQIYSLEKGAAVDFERRPVSNSQTSLGGTSETLLDRTDIIWTIQTVLLTQSELKYWTEFLASVESGEAFTLDPYGTIALPDNPVQVELAKKNSSYKPDRVGPMHYQIKFQARQL